MAAQNILAPAAIATRRPVPYQEISVTVYAFGILKFLNGFLFHRKI